MRPFAVFDIDGTVIRWQLYHALGDALAKRGLIDGNSFTKVREARMSWKKRGKDDSFKAYELELIKAFDNSLKGMPQEEFLGAADQVFEEYKDQVYTYTRDMVQQLKSKNYLLFAISGSPSYIVNKLADYYGFDDSKATDYEIVEGKMTGQMNLRFEDKPKCLRELVDAHSATFDGSIGVGDSEGDTDMLKIVETAIAFNPSRQLFEVARTEDWQIIVERKNVIYQLNSSDGSYILA